MPGFPIFTALSQSRWRREFVGYVPGQKELFTGGRLADGIAAAGNGIVRGGGDLMHIEFVGRGYTITAKQRAHATEYLERIFPMIPNATGARIVLGVDKYRHIAEVELLGPAGDFVARCEGKDMDQALHDAMHRVEQQLVHHNQRNQTIRGHVKPIDTESAEDLGVTSMLNAQ